MRGMVDDKITEVIFIGMPGPTHHYGGLSGDNVASSANRGSVSNPRLAAQQALALARRLRGLGLTVGLFPPQLRPHLPLLAERFPIQEPTPERLINLAASEAPALLEAACSSSAMWSANAATVTAAPENTDQGLHLTPANLFTNQHRRIEASDTHALLSAIFANVPGATVHAPLVDLLRDEGAANHMRLTPSHGERGLNVFVYGTDGSEDDPATARQTLTACEVIAMQHGVPAACSLFIRQNPDVIRKGVFHNDVIAVANESVLLAHEEAFAGGQADIAQMQKSYFALTGVEFTPIIIRKGDLSVEEAVQCYFFNSQLVTKPSGAMAVIAPLEVSELFGGKAEKLLARIAADPANPIDEIITLDLRQSMRNGGGPACLRLRVPMSPLQVEALRAQVNVLVDDELLEKTGAIIERFYPESLTAGELADPAHYHHCRAMRAELLALMRLPQSLNDSAF